MAMAAKNNHATATDIVISSLFLPNQTTPNQINKTVIARAMHVSTN